MNATLDQTTEERAVQTVVQLIKGAVPWLITLIALNLLDLRDNLWNFFAIVATTIYAYWGIAAIRYYRGRPANPLMMLYSLALCGHIWGYDKSNSRIDWLEYTQNNLAAVVLALAAIVNLNHVWGLNIVLLGVIGLYLWWLCNRFLDAYDQLEYYIIKPMISASFVWMLADIVLVMIGVVVFVY